jgi:hypothetical protein
MELNSEDVLKLNVLLASKPQAIRIDESSMSVLGLSDRGEAKVSLNPVGREEQYVRKVKELLSGHILGSPGGYPVYLQRWTRMGQMRDQSLEQLLLLGESEAVVGVACAPGLTDELARRAWWAMPEAENARRMLASEAVVKGGMGKVLAAYLVDYLPFETEAETMIETVLRLVLQPGLLDQESRQALWKKAQRKNAYYVGFLAATPDDLFDGMPARGDIPEYRARLQALAEAGNAYAASLLRVLSPQGQAFLATSIKVLQKASTQDVVTIMLDILANRFRDMRPEGNPDQVMDELIAEASEQCSASGSADAQVCSEAVQELLPELKAMRILSGMGYGVVRPVFRDTTAIGSLMRRKLEPVMGPIMEQLRILQGKGT